MIPQYIKKQILASYDEPIDTNVLWLHLQRTEEFKTPILKYYSPHGWISLNDSLWDFNVNGVLIPKNNYKFSLTDAIEIKIQNGDPTLFLNEKGDFVTIDIPTPILVHPQLQDKNQEPEFQHVDTTEETEGITKIAVLNGSNKVVISPVKNLYKVEKKVAKFGRLYNQSIARSENIGLNGFDVPTYNECTELRTLVGEQIRMPKDR